MLTHTCHLTYSPRGTQQRKKGQDKIAYTELHYSFCTGPHILRALINDSFIWMWFLIRDPHPTPVQTRTNQSCQSSRFAGEKHLLHTSPYWGGAVAAGTAVCASPGTAGAAAAPPAAAGPGPGRGPGPRSPVAEGPTGFARGVGAAAVAWPWMLPAPSSDRWHLQTKQGRPYRKNMVFITFIEIRYVLNSRDGFVAVSNDA